MKKAFTGLTSVKSLFDNYKSLAIISAFLTISLFATAQVQYDSTRVLQNINADGYSYKNLELRGKLRLWRDTFPMAFKDSGSIAYKNQNIYIWTGRSWKQPGSSFDSSYLKTLFSRDGSVHYEYSVTRDTIFSEINVDSLLTGINSSGISDGILFVQSLQLIDSSVSVVPNIIYARSGVKDTLHSGTSIVIPAIAAGSHQRNIIALNTSNVIDTLRGIIDTARALPPALPAGWFQICIVDVDGSTITINPPAITTNSWNQQGNAPIPGAVLGSLTAQSVRLQTAGKNVMVFDSAQQVRMEVENNARYPNLFTIYNKATGSLPIYKLSTGTDGTELSINGNNSNFQSPFSIKTGAGGDSLKGQAYKPLVLKPYDYVKVDPINAPVTAFIVSQANTPLFTVGSVYRPGVVVSNAGDSSANLGAAFSINSTNKGFLPPRQNTTQMNAISPLHAGLVVYNTDSTALCYYNGTAWRMIGISSGGSSGWSLTGNAGTDPTINFLGTTDAQPLYLRVNNDTIAKFGIDKNVSIGGSAATGYLSFSTGVGQAIGEASVAMNANTIAFGGNSVALGAATTATGESSLATGRYTVSNGISSIAGGVFSNANGNNSASFGQYVTAKSRNSFVIGRNNDTTAQANDDTTVLFRIGNGYATVGDVNGIPSNILTTTYTGLLIGNHTSETNLATLHVKGTDTFALMVTGMGNSVVGTDSAVVRDINGNFKVAAKSSTDTSSISNRINLKANIASPTFTGTVTIPTPFTLGATSVTSTGTQLNYLNAATGTTGTTSTNLVYSTSPTLVTPTLGAASGTSLVIGGTLGSSSLFDVQSTTNGILIPRMTTTQRDAISSAGSQLLITNTTTNNLDKYNGTEWEPVSAALTPAILAMNAGGSPFIAETVGMNSPFSITGSTSLGSGTPGYCAIYINKRVTLTGAAFYMATQGNFTGNNVNSIGLYSYSAGTITKIAETANDPNIWKNTLNTFVQVPFSSTISVAAGLYFLAVSYSSSAQTTAPALGRGATMLAAQVNSPNTTNSFKLNCFRTGQTSLPSTESMSNLTANPNPFYLAVY